jgi:drug/metabolite transporter superfamily protein YnfA
MWEQFSITCYQVWIWLKSEVYVHPFLFLGIVVVIVSAWVMYKSEVRTR